MEKRGAYFRFYSEEDWEVVPLCWDCCEDYLKSHSEFDGYEFWEELEFDKQRCLVCEQELYE